MEFLLRIILYKKFNNREIYNEKLNKLFQFVSFENICVCMCVYHNKHV